MAFPPTVVKQEEIVAELKDYWRARHLNVERLEKVHKSAQVETRHLALPPAEYRALDTFQKRNDAWIRIALELGEAAVKRALDRANARATDIDHFFFTTITGLATPSIDARLCHRMGFRSDIKRTPIFGLGCVAGAAGIARAADYLRAYPHHRVLLLSVELCSLTMQQQDVSVANIVAAGLFGDGAAAAVLGSDGRGPRVIDSTAVLFPNSEHAMGWDFVDTGFKIVLSADVPDLTREHIGHDVDAFLAKHQLKRSDITHWVMHTGGPKVLEAMQDALTLPEGALARSWQSLKSVGNLSSGSVLHVLDGILRDDVAKPGERGLLLAMGPGFCCEMSLLQW